MKFVTKPELRSQIRDLMALIEIVIAMVIVEHLVKHDTIVLYI